VALTNQLDRIAAKLTTARGPIFGGGTRGFVLEPGVTHGRDWTTEIGLLADDECHTGLLTVAHSGCGDMAAGAEHWC